MHIHSTYEGNSKGTQKMRLRDKIGVGTCLLVSMSPGMPTSYTRTPGLTHSSASDSVFLRDKWPFHPHGRLKLGSSLLFGSLV